MGKFDEKVEMYKAEMKKLGISYDDAKFLKVAKACGPSIYTRDAETVSGSDQAELDRVKNNYLIKKLGMADDGSLDGIVNHAVDTMGKSNRNKYRAIFYYVCSAKAGKFPG